MSVNKRDDSELIRVLIYGIGCLYMGWGVRLEDVVLYMGWSVNKRDRMLENGIGCYVRDGALVNGIGC